MLTKVANLLFALCALLVALAAWLDWRWAGSPPRQPAIDSEPLMVAVALAVCWFASAVGLFYRSRAAWVGSLVGAALSALALGACVAGILWLYVFPGAELHSLRDSAVGSYIPGIIIALAQLSALWGVALALVAGLFKMRKTSSGGGRG